MIYLFIGGGRFSFRYRSKKGNCEMKEVGESEAAKEEMGERGTNG